MNANEINTIITYANGWDSSITNFPSDFVNVTGVMITSWIWHDNIGDTSTYRQQILYGNNGNVWSRSYENNGWTDWKSKISTLTDELTVKALSWTPVCPRSDVADKITFYEANARQYGKLVLFSIRVELSDSVGNYMPIVNLPTNTLIGRNLNNYPTTDGPKAWYLQESDPYIVLRSVFPAGNYYFSGVYLISE